MTLTRRTFLAATAAAALAAPAFAAEPALSPMGIAIASYAARWSARLQTPKHPKWNNALDVLEHCRAIGAGGIQINVKDWTGDFPTKVRERREKMGLYLEGQIQLPKDEKDVDRFINDLRAAQEAGITILRTAAGNRRYEDFETVEAFRQFKENALRSITLAEPLLG